MVSMIFKANSILGALVVLSFVGWLVGIGLKATNELIGAQIVSVAMPVFIITFAIWVVFILFSILRNIKSFK